MCACAYICVYVQLYVCAYVYVSLYIRIYLHRYRESLSVHTFPSLPAPHGTKSSCGRLDESLWHGLLLRCSQAVRSSVLMQGGTCTSSTDIWELLSTGTGGLMWAQNVGPEAPSTRSVSKWPCPGPILLSSWQPVVWQGRKAVTLMQGVGKPPKSNYLSSSLGKCLLN